MTSNLFEGGIDLTKYPKKGGDGKIADGSGDPKTWGFCRKEGMLLVWVFFLAGVWQLLITSWS